MPKSESAYHTRFVAGVGGVGGEAFSASVSGIFGPTGRCFLKIWRAWQLYSHISPDNMHTARPYSVIEKVKTTNKSRFFLGWWRGGTAH